MSSSATILRLQNEVQEIKRNPPALCGAGPKNRDLFKWEATITGPLGSPYEHHIFRLDIAFPPDFPSSPPAVSFATKIYHMNVFDNGQICLDILRTRWIKEINVANILMAVSNLLANPNPDDPACGVKGREFKESKEKYLRTAREMTRKYARLV